MKKIVSLTTLLLTSLLSSCTPKDNPSHGTITRSGDLTTVCATYQGYRTIETVGTLTGDKTESVYRLVFDEQGPSQRGSREPFFSANLQGPFLYYNGKTELIGNIPARQPTVLYIVNGQPQGLFSQAYYDVMYSHDPVIKKTKEKKD